MSTIHFRQATLEDAKQICVLYNHFVSQTTISFEQEPVTVEDMQNRILMVSTKWCWLVAVCDGELLGYAYASTWRARAAYRYTVESAIYLSQTEQHKGLGTRLYQALLAQLKDKGYHVVIATIAGVNPVSEHLHTKLGFKKIGHYPEVGFKNNQWVGITTYQLILS